MGKYYADKMKRLSAIGDRAISFFLITCVGSVIILLLGGLVAAIITGSMDYMRIVMTIFLFGLAISGFSMSTFLAAQLWKVIIEKVSGLIKLRECISGVVGFCCCLLISLGVGFSMLFHGMLYMLDPHVLNGCP